MSRVLITGGAGFIGSHLTHAVLAKGHGVTVLDNFHTGHERNLQGAVGDLEVVRGDICNESDVTVAMKDVATVLHHAALTSVTESTQRPLRCHQVNVDGTVMLLEGARAAGARRFVFASSSAVYGEGDDGPKLERDSLHPKSPYAVSKLASEHYLDLYASLYGMQTLSLRYFNVFGPRQDPASEYAAVIPKFVERMIRGEPPVVYGDGQQTRDFCFVDNVVRANLLALDTPTLKGERANIATGHSISLLILISVLNRLLGTSFAPVFAEARMGDIRSSSADISTAYALLGYVPSVSLEDGLRATVEHFRQRRND